MTTGFFAKGPHVELEQLIQLRHLTSGVKLFTKKSFSSVSGQYKSSIRGRGMDFDEVRLYQPGDDVRSIDWRVTARTSKPYTKIFREEKDRPVIVAVDQNASMFFGTRVTYKSVMAAQLASLIAWAVLNQNDKVGGVVFSQNTHKNIKPQRNKNAVLAFLKSITEFNLSHSYADIAQFDFSGMLEKLLHVAKPGTAVYIISDFMKYDQASERILHLLKRHNDVYALIVADAMEQTLPKQGIYSVTDGINIFRFDSSDKNLAQQYSESFRLHQKNLNQSLDKLGITHVTVWTQDNPLKAIQHLSGN